MTDTHGGRCSDDDGDERSVGEALFVVLLLLYIPLMDILMTAAHMGMVLDMESGKRLPLLVASTMMAPCEWAA